ncbi:hypothetical protein AB4144_55505, partial [Rhizobiaceae sp. 2RAB30]
VWTHPGVTNWYKNSVGRIALNWPGRLVDYRDVTAEFDPTEYHMHRLSVSNREHDKMPLPQAAAGAR